jgi:hypothetical protein
MLNNYLKSLVNLSDSEVESNYHNFIVTKNKKVMDSKLSLIKPNKKKAKATSRGNIYEFNTRSYLRSIRKNNISQNINGIFNGTRSIYTSAGKDIKKVFDYSFKDNQNIVISIIKSNEYFENKLLGETPLRIQESAEKLIITNDTVQKSEDYRKGRGSIRKARRKL